MSGYCKKGSNCKFRHLSSNDIENELITKFDTSTNENNNTNTNKNKKSLFLMMENSNTPKRLVWNMDNKSWEWHSSKNDEDIQNNEDDKNSPKRNGWCWEGIHCTNP